MPRGLGWRLVAVPAVLAGVIALPVGTVKASDSGDVIYEAETEYQYARVVEEPDGDRLLELNEGQAVHSLYRPGATSPATTGTVTWFLPFAARDEPPRRSRSSATPPGHMARAYGHYFPGTEIDGVEIDGELTEVGRRFFDLDTRTSQSTTRTPVPGWGAARATMT